MRLTCEELLKLDAAKGSDGVAPGRDRGVAEQWYVQLSGQPQQAAGRVATRGPPPPAHQSDRARPSRALDLLLFGSRRAAIPAAGRPRSCDATTCAGTPRPRCGPCWAWVVEFGTHCDPISPE